MSHQPTDDGKARDKERVKDQLANSEHALADGILCAINDVTEVKTAVRSLSDSMGSLSESVSKIHKVIAGDPEFHLEGLIQKQNVATKRHFDVMDKLDDLESKKIKEIETSLSTQKLAAETWRTEKGAVIDKIPAIETDIARIKTWGSAGLVFLTLVEIALKVFGK